MKERQKYLVKYSFFNFILLQKNFNIFMHKIIKGIKKSKKRKSKQLYVCVLVVNSYFFLKNNYVSSLHQLILLIILC